MSEFKVHTKTSAPDSADLLGGAEKVLGFIPNLFGVFAESPTTLNAYLRLTQALEESSLSEAERQVAVLAVSRNNESPYCVAVDSAIARMRDVPPEIVDAVRNDERLPDPRLQALYTFTTCVMDKRGYVTDDDVAAFKAAGYTNAQVLEVVLAIALKTLSNYVNHMAQTPLDDEFRDESWQPDPEK